MSNRKINFLKQNSYARHSEIKFASSRWILEKQLNTSITLKSYCLHHVTVKINGPSLPKVIILQFSLL